MSCTTAELIIMYCSPEEVVHIYCPSTNQTRKVLQISVRKVYKIMAHARATPIRLYRSLEKLYTITRFIVIYLYNFMVVTVTDL